ncbi:MAG: DUF362 domain-containing protein [Candidatus Aminicenantaceae bacterium]
MKQKEVSKVFFIPASRNEENQSLAYKTKKIFTRLNPMEFIEKNSFVALKIHFGERGNEGFINPEWLLSTIDLIKEKKARVFLSDTNTLYTGNRSNSIDHLHLAWKHGFTQKIVGIPVIIADGMIGWDDNEVQIGLPRVKSAKIASAFLASDFMVCLSHFTGHISTGFGGAIKNMGMGCASRAGKLEQHSDAIPRINPDICTGCRTCMEYCPAHAIGQKEDHSFIIEKKCIGCGECLVVCPSNAVKYRWDSDCRRVQEKMSEYAFSVKKHFNNNICFINYLLKVTKDCDCISKKGLDIVDDIGIIGSLDPVALDKASVDLVNKRIGKDMRNVGYNVDWSVQLIHGEKIGLGNMDYELIEVK